MYVSILLQSSATPLSGPVIKASASRTGDPGIDPLLFPLESYQGFEHWHFNNNNNTDNNNNNNNNNNDDDHDDADDNNDNNNNNNNDNDNTNDTNNNNERVSRASFHLKHAQLH